MEYTTKNDILYRDASSKDFESVHDILKDAFEMDLQKDNYERLLASDNSHIIVAESNDVIGVLGFEVQNDLYNGKKKAFINYGAVELAHQKKGIYGTLVNIVKDFSRKNEIATIELTCAMHRSNSHKFYFNNDFTIKKTFVFINEVK